MPDDNDPTLVLLRRMDEKLDRLLADRADWSQQLAALEPSTVEVVRMIRTERRGR